ncbi:transposase [Neorhizobium galegae]|uniref:transposase n=1 Tax=Neorhizobium galegae TaxID=399 RepID=UPI00351D56A0
MVLRASCNFFWSDEFKVEAVEEACRPGVNISAIARKIGITPSQLYRWRRDLLNESDISEIPDFSLL